jgi:hypothetical protein
MKLKHRMNGCAIALAASLSVPASGPATAAPASADPYQPLAFLIGHCWKGSFLGDTRMTDEHCFSWMYGGKFVRDEHFVHDAQGGPDKLGGETIYVWNSAARELEYLYVESSGAFLRGTVTADGESLVFPAAAHVDNGKSTNVRSRWQRAGDDAYDVITEFQVEERWVRAFSLHMQRVRNAPT